MTESESVALPFGDSALSNYWRMISPTIRDYTGLGNIQYLIGKENLTIIDTIYTEQVEILAMVPEELQTKMEKEMIEATSGNAVISWGEEVLYAMVEKNLKIFEKIS